MITDAQYMQFMQRLAEDQRGENPLLLPAFEIDFLDSFMRAGRPSLWFTPGRRPVTDQMWRRWGGELNFPHPLDRVADRQVRPTMVADQNGCEYLVKDDAIGQLQRRCNEPAEFHEARRPGSARRGLQYCRAHAEWVKRTCPGIVLDPWRPLT